jgi:hypothetical protein
MANEAIADGNKQGILRFRARGALPGHVQSFNKSFVCQEGQQHHRAIHYSATECHRTSRW